MNPYRKLFDAQRDSLDEGRYRHPDPTRTGRVYVQDENGIRIGVICTKRRNVGAALLADVRSPVVDDYVVAGALEVFYEISSNFPSGFSSSTTTSRVATPFAVSNSSSWRN
jgi:hypothetical protein